MTLKNDIKADMTLKLNDNIERMGKLAYIQ